MNLLESVKATVTVKQAAGHYGVEVQINGMFRCPFHNDHHPSMKLNEDFFFCFGCGATGDVIDLVSRLFGLSSYDAAQKLACDFGLDQDKPPAAAALRKPEYPLARAFQREELHCQRYCAIIFTCWKTGRSDMLLLVPMKRGMTALWRLVRWWSEWSICWTF